MAKGGEEPEKCLLDSLLTQQRNSARNFKLNPINDQGLCLNGFIGARDDGWASSQIAYHLGGGIKRCRFRILDSKEDSAEESSSGAAAHLHKGPFHDVRFFTPSDPIIFSEKDCRRRRRSVLFDVDRGRSLGYILPQIAPRARRCHDPASLHVHKSAVGVLLLLLLLLPFLLLGLVLVEPVDGGGGEGAGRERDVPNLPRTVFLLLLLPSADICIG